MSRKKLLVVDDDQLIGWALAKGLSGENLHLRVVETGQDALREIDEEKYHLVLLDIHLPDANGLELLADIREKSPDSRVIVTSADITESNKERAVRGGAFQFLEKPFTISVIQQLLKSTLAPPSERRKHPRYLCNFPLSVGFLVPCPGDDPESTGPLQGAVFDVGTRGVCLTVDRALAIGQELCLSPASDGGVFERFIPSRTKAEVVWVTPVTTGSLAGLRFVS